MGLIIVLAFIAVLCLLAANRVGGDAGTLLTVLGWLAGAGAVLFLILYLVDTADSETAAGAVALWRLRYSTM